MAGMPGMQEQFPAMAMDGRYAENAGAISGAGNCPMTSDNVVYKPAKEWSAADPWR